MEDPLAQSNRTRWFLLVPAFIACIAISMPIANKIFSLAHEWSIILFDWPNWWATLVFGVVCYGAVGFGPVFVPSVYVAPSKNFRVAKILAAVTVVLWLLFFGLLAYITPQVAETVAEKWGFWFAWVGVAILISGGAILAVYIVGDLEN